MSEEHKPEENLRVGKAAVSEGREIKQDGEAIHQSEYQEYCRTPTSEEHKIPRAQSCPPAPRKPKVQEQVSFLRKRKLLEFYDNIVKDEEVESLFGPSSAAATSSVEISRVSSSWPHKRRCRSR